MIQLAHGGPWEAIILAAFLTYYLLLALAAAAIPCTAAFAIWALTPAWAKKRAAGLNDTAVLFCALDATLMWGLVSLVGGQESFQLGVFLSALVWGGAFVALLLVRRSFFAPPPDHLFWPVVGITSAVVACFCVPHVLVPGEEGWDDLIQAALCFTALGLLLLRGLDWVRLFKAEPKVVAK